MELKGVKFRIYPDEGQKTLIQKTFGCCRLIYNKGLAMREEAYKNGEKVGYSQTCKMVTELKQAEEFAFLKEPETVALQQSLRDLDRAFANFFKKRAKYPKFKSKRDRHQSYRTFRVKLAGNRLWLPKVGWVKAKPSMPVGKIHNATVTCTPTGKYFAALLAEFDTEPLPRTDRAVGIDVGIRTFCVASDGAAVPNPMHLEKAMEKIKREQRKLSRRKTGSKNWEKQRRKVALAHEKAVNQRNDFLHKLSTALVRENQTICVRDRKIKDMVQDRALALSVASASWRRFFDMLSYKCGWYGRSLVMGAPEPGDWASRIINGGDSRAAGDILKQGLAVLPA